MAEVFVHGVGGTDFENLFAGMLGTLRSMTQGRE